MKKHDMMKKFTAAALSLTMMAGLAACSGGSSSASSGAAPAPAVSGSETGGTAIKVAVVKQMDHASLDEIANAITARLDEIAAEQGITIDYGQVYSGQGDETILNQIGAQVVADGVDVIIPVATTAAQLMTVAAEGTGIPVVYAAVSDPEQADLLDLDYVTGMSDALNTQFILDMMLAQDPEAGEILMAYGNGFGNGELIQAAAEQLREFVFGAELVFSAAANVTALIDQSLVFIPMAEKGAPGGVAPLGEDGKVPEQYLPELNKLDAAVQVSYNEGVS